VPNRAFVFDFWVYAIPRRNRSAARLSCLLLCLSDPKISFLVGSHIVASAGSHDTDLFNRWETYVLAQSGLYGSPFGDDPRWL